MEDYSSSSSSSEDEIYYDSEEYMKNKGGYSSSKRCKGGKTCKKGLKKVKSVKKVVKNRSKHPKMNKSKFMTFKRLVKKLKGGVFTDEERKKLYQITLLKVPEESEFWPEYQQLLSETSILLKEPLYFKITQLGLEEEKLAADELLQTNQQAAIQLAENKIAKLNKAQQKLEEDELLFKSKLNETLIALDSYNRKIAELTKPPIDDSSIAASSINEAEENAKRLAVEQELQKALKLLSDKKKLDDEVDAQLGNQDLDDIIDDQLDEQDIDTFGYIITNKDKILKDMEEVLKMKAGIKDLGDYNENIERYNKIVKKEELPKKGELPMLRSKLRIQSIINNLSTINKIEDIEDNSKIILDKEELRATKQMPKLREKLKSDIEQIIKPYKNLETLKPKKRKEIIDSLNIVISKYTYDDEYDNFIKENYGKKTSNLVNDLQVYQPKDEYGKKKGPTKIDFVDKLISFLSPQYKQLVGVKGKQYNQQLQLLKTMKFETAKVQREKQVEQAKKIEREYTVQTPPPQILAFPINKKEVTVKQIYKPQYDRRMLLNEDSEVQPAYITENLGYNNEPNLLPKNKILYKKNLKERPQIIEDQDENYIYIDDESRVINFINKQLTNFRKEKPGRLEMELEPKIRNTKKIILFPPKVHIQYTQPKITKHKFKFDILNSDDQKTYNNVMSNLNKLNNIIPSLRAKLMKKKDKNLQLDLNELIKLKTYYDSKVVEFDKKYH